MRKIDVGIDCRSDATLSLCPSPIRALLDGPWAVSRGLGRWDGPRLAALPVQGVQPSRTHVYDEPGNV